MDTKNPPTETAIAAIVPPVPFGSNEVRLTGRQWLIALLFVAVVFVAVVFAAVPAVWQRIEPLEITPDYRIPFRLGSDYWVYQRWCKAASGTDQTLLLGDSVVWGHYVSSEETLSHYLSQQAGSPRLANLGVDGIHPAAMFGLVEYYGGDISGKNVILHCNLLWTISPQRDLQDKKQSAFNHPRLVPQFWPAIPCYQESYATRAGIVVGREVPLFQWADHLRIAYFDSNDLPHWTLEHPRDDPALAVTLRLPSPDEPPDPPPVARPWTEQRSPKFHPAWVELETSLQWRFFRDTVALLRARKNRVFVLVGPFNEHMLTDAGREVYHQRLRDVEAWLQSEEIPYYVPPALPSELYADLSHPLAAGYARLARELSAQPAFADFQRLNGTP